MQLTCTDVGSLGRQAFYTPKLVPAFWRFRHSKEGKYSLSDNIIIRQIIIGGTLSMGLTDQAESAESNQSWLQTQTAVLHGLCSATQETLSCSVMWKWGVGRGQWSREGQMDQSVALGAQSHS